MLLIKMIILTAIKLMMILFLPEGKIIFKVYKMILYIYISKWFLLCSNYHVHHLHIFTLSFTFLANFSYVVELFNYNHHVIHQILRPYSSYNWKFVPIYQPLLISSTPNKHFSTLYFYVFPLKKKITHVNGTMQYLSFSGLFYLT